MTSKLTRERIEQYANDPRMCNINDEIREMARMALTAMDSEPVAEVLSNRPGNDTSTIDRALPVGTQLYRHAQQPVVPDAYVRDERGRMMLNGVCEPKIGFSAGWNACRAAMLQHQPQNAQQNIPENIPGGLVEAVNNLLNNDGSRGCYDAMECGTAREKIESWLAQRQRWEEQRKANLSAGNSPVIPNGYVMVPKEPTERMVIDGFESEPDETFSEPEVWEAFQKMSGCEQAAYRVRLCWAAMLAAAPQDEAKKDKPHNNFGTGARLTNHRFKV
ncbi:hypothetical protein AAG122_09715 [Raoultella planticola]|uniref:hypothetical protein n=1 Tax=Raoultella planticola TaxID=575 RepID=UPI0031BB5710